MTATSDSTAPISIVRAGDPTVATRADGLTAYSSDSLKEESGGSPTTDTNPDKSSALDALRRKTTINVLLIGETGTGKTAFMSLLVNLFQGRGPLNLEDMHDKGAESGLSKNQSQTTKATLYTVTTSDGRKINILDTPGLADTRGIDQDNVHKAEINRAIREHITTVDAVLIMANGSLQRLGAATDYTLSALTSMFPRSIIENIGFIFTHSDSGALNFQRESLPEELRKSKYWAIQNPLGRLNSYNQMNECDQPPANTHLRKLKGEYEDSVETLNEWLKWLDERPTTPTNEIHELYERFHDIESKIEASLASITRLSEQRKKWVEAVTTLGNSKDHKARIEALVNQQRAPVWYRQPSESYNTICIAADCYSNCHTPCNWIYVTSPWLLRYLCSAFPYLSNTCRVCNHEADQHRRYKYINVSKPGELDEKTKLRWEDARTEEEMLQVAQNIIAGELDRIEADTDKMQTEIHHLIDDYNNISLSKNFCGHIRSALQILEYRRNELQAKAGTDTELAVVEESITKLKEKLGVIEEQKNYYDRSLEALRRAGDVVRAVVST